MMSRYFFVVTNYFLYGESIIYYFKHIVFVDAYFIPFARNHRFISFMLYVVGMCDPRFDEVKLKFCLRFRWICWEPPKAVSPPTICPFLLGPYQLAPHCGLEVSTPLDSQSGLTTQSLHHQQHTRGSHLVLRPSISCHLQRRDGLRVW